MPGKIQIEFNGVTIQSHDLRFGINKIGRRSEPSQKASPEEILINCEDYHIHRKYHCTIEVILENNEVVYILAPYEDASNFTLLGTECAQLEKEDQIYLQDDSTFYLSENTRIKFFEK